MLQLELVDDEESTFVEKSTPTAPAPSSSSSSATATTNLVLPPPPALLSNGGKQPKKKRKNDVAAAPGKQKKKPLSMSIPLPSNHEDADSEFASSSSSSGVSSDRIADISKMKAPELKMHLIEAWTQLRSRQSHKSCESLAQEYKNQIHYLKTELEFQKKKHANEIDLLKQERDATIKQVTNLAEMNARTFKEEKSFLNNLVSRSMNTTDHAGASLISVLGKSQDHVSLAMQKFVHPETQQPQQPQSQPQPQQPPPQTLFPPTPMPPAPVPPAPAPPQPPTPILTPTKEKEMFDAMYPADIQSSLLGIFNKSPSTPKINEINKILADWLTRTITSNDIFETHYKSFRNLQVTTPPLDHFKSCIVAQTLDLFEKQKRSNLQKLLAPPLPIKSSSSSLALLPPK